MDHPSGKASLHECCTIAGWIIQVPRLWRMFAKGSGDASRLTPAAMEGLLGCARLPVSDDVRRQLVDFCSKGHDLDKFMPICAGLSASADPISGRLSIAGRPLRAG